MPKKTRALTSALVAVLVALAVLFGVDGAQLGKNFDGLFEQPGTTQLPAGNAESFTLDLVPAYAGEPSVVINGNTPFFSQSELDYKSGKVFTTLDRLGRCGSAFMVAEPSQIPSGERESISSIKPSGWRQASYDWVDGESLYNRCHLLGYMLSGENANDLNLITGTRTMNKEGMLPYEEQVVRYVERTGNSVIYRVTPVFEGDNLVASGVLMEAYSVQDSGRGVQFCVWCYNVEPGVVIDYATGESSAGDPVAAAAAAA